MNAAIYARKSTAQDDTAEDAKSVTRQVAGARAFIKAKGWTVDDGHVYIDDGISGALFLGRPEFQRLMRDAKAGQFEAVVFYDLDRFGRNGRRSMEALYALTEDMGIEVWDYSTGQALDLDSLEGEMSAFLKTRFAQQYRDQVRKHTRDAMRRIAERGFVTGGLVFGYDNVGTKGQRQRRINDAEAAVVRDIYGRFAAGEGLRTIALGLNRAGAPSPRAQQGRPNGWSASSVREVLQRPVYRGEVVFGRTAARWGRELGKGRSSEDHAQIHQPEHTWTVVQNEALRIVTPDLAARVDARRESWRRRAAASKAQGHAPQRAHGKYLLSGGMLVCPTCGGHFEAYISPWTQGAVYVCATRRRKPGVCTNALRLPLAETDEAVLEIVAGEVLDHSVIEELLALVDRGEADQTAHLQAERDRLQREVQNLVAAIVAGVPPDTVAADIRQREGEMAKLDARLRAPRPVAPNIEKLRAALTLRAEQWKRSLREEPTVGRLLLRRLLDPITLWDADRAVKSPEWVAWEASARPQALLESDAIQLVASPTGFEPVFRP